MRGRTLDEPARSRSSQTFGEIREVERGDMLYRAGEPTPDFFVVLEGEVEIVRRDDSGETGRRDATARTDSSVS